MLAAVPVELPLNSLAENGVRLPWHQRKHHHFCYYKKPITLPKLKNNVTISCSGANSSDSLTSTTTTTTTTSSSSSSCGGKVLELREISERCKKWLWKGQYSINYFVSAPFISGSQSNSFPPLLLVHGFGASIPHWRRLVVVWCVAFTIQISLSCCYLSIYTNYFSHAS